MKQSKLVFLLYTLILTGITVSSINCMGTGSMNGNIGVNINDQPIWGPEGYDHAEYYYIPDIDSYYSVPEHQYIYRNGSAWTRSAAPPSTYSGFDVYRSYKVVINENNPYQNNQIHKAKYEMYKGKKDQPVIRDSRDPKYFIIKDHPEHDKWVKEHQQH